MNHLHVATKLLAISLVLAAGACKSDKKKKPDDVVLGPPGTIGGPCDAENPCFAGDCVNGVCTATDAPLLDIELCALYLAQNATMDPEGAGLCVQQSAFSAMDFPAGYVEYACRPGTSGYQWAKDLLKATSENRVTMDWVKAKECLGTTRYLRANHPSYMLTEVPEWIEAEQTVCSEYYAGAIAAGGDCLEDWDCPQGMGCYSLTPTTPDSAKCAAPAGGGEPCNVEFFPCEEAYRCNEDGGNWTCGDKLPNDADCGSNSDCASGYCDLTTNFVCMDSPYKAPGETCDSAGECNGECLSCLPNDETSDPICQRLHATGEYCRDWWDCLWDLGCVNNICGAVVAGAACGSAIEALCEPGTYCLPSVNCGELSQNDCDTASDCEWDSYYGCLTAGGTCVAETELPTSGACYGIGYCAPGYFCDEDTTTCLPLGEQGAACSDTQPCNTDLGYACVSDVCVKACVYNEDCPENEYCYTDPYTYESECQAMNTSACTSHGSCPGDTYCDWPNEHCFAVTDKATCAGDANCVFIEDGDCLDNGYCGQFMEQTPCDQDGSCGWFEMGDCEYVANCAQFPASADDCLAFTASPDDCAVFTTAPAVCRAILVDTDCNADPACTWNVGTNECESDCLTATGCRWAAGPQACVDECSTTPGCFWNTNTVACEDECSTTDGCYWDTDTCKPVCAQYDGDSANCLLTLGCRYDATNDWCLPTCDLFDDDGAGCATHSPRCVFTPAFECLTQVNCLSITEPGNCAPTCDTLVTEGTCNADPLCHWNTTSGSCSPDCYWDDVLYDACVPTCWAWDGDATGCGEQTGDCTWNASQSWCEVPCDRYHGATLEADCSADIQCAWTSNVCSSTFDCAQHNDDLTGCNDQVSCAFSGSAYCDRADWDATGTCEPKEPVGTVVVSDNAEILTMYGIATDSDDASACQSGWAVQMEDGTFQCTVRPTEPMEGCLFVNTATQALVNLTFLFGGVWFFRRRRR